MGLSGLSQFVVDASALIELLLQERLGLQVETRLRDSTAHAPAHLDAEVLSALGRLSRAGAQTEDEVADRLDHFSHMPIHRYELRPLLQGAWARRHNVSLRDALYVELAVQLDLPLLTTDGRLAASCSTAELVT